VKHRSLRRWVADELLVVRFSWLSLIGVIIVIDATDPTWWRTLLVITVLTATGIIEAAYTELQARAKRAAR
jgi:hypothetical protein